MIDLESLDTKQACDRGATLELRHPETAQPIGVKITLAGVDSKLYVETSNRLAAERSNLNLTPSRMKAMRQGRPIELTGDDVAEQQIQTIKLLAAVTLSWEGVLISGQVVECNFDNAVNLYTRFPWIKDQVDNFVGERANFLTGSAGD